MEEPTIQDRLKEILSIKDCDRAELAKTLKVDPSQISRWLSGQQKPGGENYYNICELHKKLTKGDD